MFMRFANGIHTLIFDLDGTLRESRPSGHEVFVQFIRRENGPVTQNAERAALQWAHAYWGGSDSPVALDIHQFGRGTTEFWENYACQYLRAFGCSEAVAHALSPAINRYFAEELTLENWVPPDVIPTLQTLRAEGYAMGVLSNRDQPCHDELAELGLLPYFDFALVAGEVNAWKPDPEIFHHALQRANNAQPAHTMYIGDNYFADVVGAKGVGLQPVLIDPMGVFPQAGCPVIGTLGELLGVLGLD